MCRTPMRLYTRVVRLGLAKHSLYAKFLAGRLMSVQTAQCKNLITQITFTIQIEIVTVLNYLTSTARFTVCTVKTLNYSELQK